MLTLLDLRHPHLKLPTFVVSRYRSLDFGRSHFVSTLVVSHLVSALVVSHFSMSADNCCSVRDSSEDYPSGRKDASLKPSRQGRVSNGGDDDGSAPSLSEVPLSGDSVVAPVNVNDREVSFNFRRSAFRRDAPGW